LAIQLYFSEFDFKYMSKYMLLKPQSHKADSRHRASLTR
jgi:hypothetical protein